MSGELNVVGAGYVAALFAEDAQMLTAYRASFTDAELLAGCEHALRVMGRRIARESNRTLPEVGDAMFAAAKAFQQITGDTL